MIVNTDRVVTTTVKRLGGKTAEVTNRRGSNVDEAIVKLQSMDVVDGDITRIRVEKF